MKNIVSISAFPEEVDSWVTWRVNFINTRLLNEDNLVIRFFRWTQNKNRVKNQYIYIWSKNKYIHLFDLKIIKQIFFIKNPILYCHTIWSVFYGIFFRILWKEYIFDNHNVEFDRMLSTKRFLMAFFIYLLEPLAIRFAKKTTVLSFSDKARLHHLYWKNLKIEVVECIYEISKKIEKINRKVFFDWIWVDSTKKIVLFFAAFNYNYFPNTEALEFVQEKIIPNLGEKFHLIIAWKWSDKYQSNFQVTYLWFYPDLDQLILQADLVIAPIFSGWGVKIKVIQTLGLKQNILTTQEGLRGINSEGRHNIYMSSKDEFLSSIFDFFDLSENQNISPR